MVQLLWCNCFFNRHNICKRYKTTVSTKIYILNCIRCRTGGRFQLQYYIVLFCAPLKISFKETESS